MRRLALLTALLAFYNLGILYTALTLPPALAALLALPPALDVVAGALWALAFGGMTILLWRRAPGALKRSGFLLSVFIIYSAARALLFTQADYERGRLPFLMMLLAALGIVSFLLIRRGLWLKK